MSVQFEPGMLVPGLRSRYRHARYATGINSSRLLASLSLQKCLEGTYIGVPTRSQNPAHNHSLDDYTSKDGLSSNMKKKKRRPIHHKILLKVLLRKLMKQKVIGADE